MAATFQCISKFESRGNIQRVITLFSVLEIHSNYCVTITQLYTLFTKMSMSNMQYDIDHNKSI